MFLGAALGAWQGDARAGDAPGDQAGDQPNARPDQPDQGDETGATTGAVAPAITVDPIDVRARRRDQGSLTGEAPAAPDATMALEEPAFVTVVRVDDRAGETTSMAEVLARTVGVSVRSLGGLGSFSSMSVRGAAPGHTAVLVDGVPLSRLASASVDLSRFALTSFSELTLYRGGAPVELGSGALGGALNLETRVGPAPPGQRLSVAAGAGSFGARHGRARWLGGHARGGYHLSLGYAGATGDFSYFNDNGTNLDPGDDAFVTRQNNGYDRVDAVARYRTRHGDLTVEGGGRWSLSRQGIPGSASVQSQRTSLATVSQLLDARATRQRLLGSPRLMGRASAFLDLSWQHYQDLADEIGVGAQDRRYTTVAAGASGRVTADAGPGHVLSAGIEAQLDVFRERDALAGAGEDRGGHGLRTGLGLTLADEWALGAEERVIVRPAVRLDWLRTVPIEDRNTPLAGDDALAPRNDLFLGPRLAARVRLVPGLAAKASAGRYFRAPTAMELFGDRGFVVGNPALRAETGMSADAGLVLAPAHRVGPLDRVHVEAAAFALWPRDTIAFVTTSGLASVARNLGNARIRGVEAGASFRLARSLTVSGNYTFLMTRQDSPILSYDGKPLPNRPRHQVHGRLDAARELGGRLLSLWTDVAVTTGNMLDAAGLSQVPARQLVGAGIKLEVVPGLLVSLKGKNLLDQRVEQIVLDPPPRPDLTRVPRAVADFFGYPLPGRAFYLTAEWQR